MAILASAWILAEALLCLYDGAIPVEARILTRGLYGLAVMPHEQLRAPNFKNWTASQHVFKRGLASMFNLVQMRITSVT